MCVLKRNILSYNRCDVTCSAKVVEISKIAGIDNAIITSLDTKELSESLKEKADLVILDAPCSGEGMARKTDEIYDAYSEKELKKRKKQRKK